MSKLLLLLLVLGILLLPPIAYAAEQQVVVITANPGGNITCPTNFTINVVSAYEIQLSWTPATGGNTTGTTLIKGAYGRWPNIPTDGFRVYDDTGNSTIHWVNTEFIGVDVYYRVWAELNDGNYTACYASGSVTGGEGMEAIASEMGVLTSFVIYMLLPLFFAYLSVTKRNIVCMIICIVTSIAVMPLLADDIGVWTLVPMILIVIGIGLMLFRDTWEKQVEL